MTPSFYLFARFLAFALALHATALAAPLGMVARNNRGQAVERVAIEAGGRQHKAWKFDEESGNLVFHLESPISIPSDGRLYLKVVYLDRGYGKVKAFLAPHGGKPTSPDRFLNLTRTDSGAMVSALMRFNDLKIMENNELVVGVGLEQFKGQSLLIESVSLQNTPFEDPKFKFVISDPWNGPYEGPRVKPADNTTLKGKVMAGYQGWFRTPNDPDGRGWVHWGDISRGTFSTDMWPDVSQYPASVLEKAADVKLKSGKQAYLFSSAWPAVVDTHFRWMREHNIDGAFLQRFVTGNFNSISGKTEWVLANVRAAANREGRIWAVEYDVSGCPDGRLLEILKTDWKWFVDRFRLLEDPNYAREGGKPVVFIWGMPFPNREISSDTANQVVDFFKNDPKYGGNHVIGGIPSQWRNMDSAWQEHFKKYDCALAWMSKSYAEDIADFKRIGLDYYPHVKPGFSWANLKHLPSGDESIAYTPRNGGRTYWDQISQIAQAGGDRLFVGMFDEYDEATAIMPMSDDTPLTPVRAGVTATFSPGPHPAETGDRVHLPSMEVSLDTPPGKLTSAEHFHVMIGGQIKFPSAGNYRFSVEGAKGDDVELFLNGKPVIKANGFPGVILAKEPIQAIVGQSMPCRIGYRHRTGAGTVKLFWESETILRQPVPPSALQDAWGRFIGNEGYPADWWLQLTHQGRKFIRKEGGNVAPTFRDQTPVAEIKP